jgi:hypothetical protein
MWQRCTNPRNGSFKNYGARGITICKRWETFGSFIADMGFRPSPRHSLDRKNNAGNYTPGNCRWATPGEQQGNTRNNRVIAAFGQRKILSEWARDQKIPLDTLWRRLTTHRWPPEKALSAPLRPKKPHLAQMVRNVGYESVSDFLFVNGLSPATLYKFVNGGNLRPETQARIESLLRLR